MRLKAFLMQTIATVKISHGSFYNALESFYDFYSLLVGNNNYSVASQQS